MYQGTTVSSAMATRKRSPCRAEDLGSTPRVNPDERAGHDHVGEDHHRKIVLRFRRCPEEILDRCVIRSEQHAVYEEAAGHPKDEDDQPGEQESFVHELLSRGFNRSGGSRATGSK